MKLTDIIENSQAIEGKPTQRICSIDFARSINSQVIDGHLVSASHFNLNLEQQTITIRMSPIDRVIVIGGTEYKASDLTTGKIPGGGGGGQGGKKIFWELWKTHKDEFKVQGVKVEKFDGHFRVIGLVKLTGYSLKPVEGIIGENIDAWIKQAAKEADFNQRWEAARKARQLNPITDELRAAQAKWEELKDAYHNEERGAALGALMEALHNAGRRYFDDRVEGHCLLHGSMYGEDTMLAMLARGEFDLDENGWISGQSTDAHACDMDS